MILGENADPAVTPPVFTITASYSYGQKAVTEKRTIDLRPYMQGRTLPDPIVDELKQLREKALKEIADQIAQLRKADRRIRERREARRGPAPPKRGARRRV